MSFLLNGSTTLQTNIVTNSVLEGSPSSLCCSSKRGKCSSCVKKALRIICDVVVLKKKKRLEKNTAMTVSKVKQFYTQSATCERLKKRSPVKWPDFITCPFIATCWRTLF